MMALRGASLATKSSIRSLISKIMTMPMIRISATKKVLMNFVHEVALENWDPYNSPKNLKAKIQAFLNDYKGYGNLFQNYEIKEPTQDPVTKRITCDISLTPFYSAKNFVIKVAADKKDKEAQMS